MVIAGLTGGIGSGKTTVASGLAGRGAVVIDADRIARRVVEPGGRAYRPVVERFGRGVLQPDGTLDRPALASVIFAEDDARRDLDAITHPAIGEVITEQLAAVTDPEAVVVLDVPLLHAETVRSYGLAAVMVVDTPVEVAVARLVAHRGFTDADARARVRAQVTREERRGLTELGPPGLVIDNSGDGTALEAEIDRAWAWLRRLVG